MEEQSYTHVSPSVSRASIKRALLTFSVGQRILFVVSLSIAVIAALILVHDINDHFMVSVPSTGGTFTEGIVGTPRFTNPLLATTDADRDISTLVYRGLMKKDTEGDLVPDLAASYSISDDGLTYTFTLADNVFHDGTPVTTDDVLFTIKSAKDKTLKSMKHVEWEGVTPRIIDEKTITLTLKSRYAPFLESTTLGILPKHIWEKISYENWIYSDANTQKAIGTGPYKITAISENASGIPAYYELSAFRKNRDVSPSIDTFVMRFYANEDDLVSAFKSGDVDAIGGIDPEKAVTLAKTGAHIITSPLPRVFGLFFNQSQAKVFTDSAVRSAIQAAINKQSIVQGVMNGYGEVAYGPIPQESIGSDTQVTTDTASVAKKILEKAGWKLGSDGIYTKQISKKETRRLSFEIATSNVPELTHAVDMIVSQLHDAGIEAIPKVYETGSLNQDIIRPRKFQALFFGEVVGAESNLFAFWHSSQRSDPGLNITGYANARVDKILTTALTTLDDDKRSALYASFEKEIRSDIPAVFVYSPAFIYAVKDDTPGISIGHIISPEDRFASVSSWYLMTDRVWNIFAKH